jgi:hypothetical protein
VGAFGAFEGVGCMPWLGSVGGAREVRARGKALGVGREDTLTATANPCDKNRIVWFCRVPTTGLFLSLICNLFWFGYWFILSPLSIFWFGHWFNFTYYNCSSRLSHLGTFRGGLDHGLQGMPDLGQQS